MRFKEIDPPARLYRVAFVSDVAHLTDWQWLKAAGRWDDPRATAVVHSLDTALRDATPEHVREVVQHTMEAQSAEERAFRVLYTADDPVGAFTEILQGFRTTVAGTSNILADILTVSQDDPNVPEPSRITTGVVPHTYLGQLYAGEISVEVKDTRPFVDLEAAESVQYVRSQLLAEARRMGYKDVDRGTILGDDREFTQRVARLVYEDSERYGGIYHGSVLGRQFGNYSIFETEQEGPERSIIRTASSRQVSLDNPHLEAAVKLLGLEIEQIQERSVSEREAQPAGTAVGSRHFGPIQEISDDVVVQRVGSELRAHKTEIFTAAELPELQKDLHDQRGVEIRYGSNGATVRSRGKNLGLEL